jgi:hypothetical protein
MDPMIEGNFPHGLPPPSRCGLTELFRETGINSPHPGKSLDTSCAKTLNFSQNTVGGSFFAESQELGCVLVGAVRLAICSALGQIALCTPHAGAHPVVRSSRCINTQCAAHDHLLRSQCSFDGLAAAGHRTLQHHRCPRRGPHKRAPRSYPSYPPLAHHQHLTLQQSGAVCS